MKKWLHNCIIVLLLLGILPTCGFAQENKTIAFDEQITEFPCSSIIAHDATNEITAVGSMRQSRIPIVFPVKGQSFKRAVVIPTPDSSAVTPTLVGMRLESEFVHQGLAEGDVAVLSVWMRTEDKIGKAKPYLATKENSVRVDGDEVSLTNQWKQYFFLFQIPAEMKTVKATINVGYRNQVTYFAALDVQNYGAVADAEALKQQIFGEEYRVQAEKREEEEKQLTEKKAEALQNAVAFAVGYSTAYIKGKEQKIDENFSEVVPYIKNNKLYVPLRFTAERLGAQVTYREDTQSILLQYNGNERIAYCNQTMWRYNQKPWLAEEGLQIVEGRVFVPADILASFLDWNCQIDIKRNIAMLCSTSEAMQVLTEIDYITEVYEKAVLTPVENYAVSLVHDKIKNVIGEPALIEVTDAVPKLKITTEFDTQISYFLDYNGEKICNDISALALAGEETIIDLSEQTGILKVGEYKINLKLQIGSHESTDALYFFADSAANKKADDSKVLYKNAEGKLISVPDYRGNRIPDYSAVGYKNSAVPIPNAPAVIELNPSGGDDTAQIQAAIDAVSTLPQRTDGMRGAVLLSKGVFQVSGMFTIAENGVVLRGSGNDNAKVVDVFPTGAVDTYVEKNKNIDGTMILLTSTVPETRMMEIHGTSNLGLYANTEQEITDNYVPVGTKSFQLDNAADYKVGDEIVIVQKGNLAWVHEIGMDQIPARTTVDANVKNNEGNGINQWGEQKWQFERTIIAVDGNKITIDIPIVNAIAQKWGGAKVYKYTDSGRVQNVGIENLRVVAAWTANQNNVDETRHAGELVNFKNAKDCWVRNVTTEHLNLYDISISNSAKRITIQDYYDLVAPISYYNGEGYESTGRTFLETGVYVGRYGVFNAGQQILMQRCYGTNLRHLIEYESAAAGPNVAYCCDSERYFNQMGPHMLWSMGGLYDNTDGALHIENRLNMGSGHGWAGAWYTAWNTTDRLAVQKPPTAQNWAIGHIGAFSIGDNPQFDQGYWDLDGTHSNIQSLFVAQMQERMGEVGLEIINHQQEYDYTVQAPITDLYPEEILIDSKPLADYNKDIYRYSYITNYGVSDAPVVTAKSDKYDIEIQQADSPNGTAIVTITAENYQQSYTVDFKQSGKYYKLTSSGDDGNIAENILDRKLDTRWSANGKGQWLLFTFSNPCEIAKIAMAFYNGSKRVTSFAIEVSEDGKEYKTLYTGQSSGLSEELEDFRFVPFAAKYMRIVFDGNSVNTWNSVSELRFYNAAGTELFIEE